MVEPVKVIEEPAPPPGQWGTVAFVGGTVVWCIAAVLSFVLPDTESPRELVSAYMILPLTALFVIASAWIVVSRVRNRPFRPAVYRQDGERIVFRFKHPREGAVLGMVLTSAVSFIPILVAVALVGPRPWAMIVAPIPVVALGGVLGYFISRCVYARGDRDYVIGHGKLELPQVRGGRWTAVRETIDVREIDAVLVSSSELMIRTPEDSVVVAVHRDGYTEGFRRGQWLAGLLGVPLMRIRMIRTPNRPPWGALIGGGLLMLYLFATVCSFAWIKVHDEVPTVLRPTAVVPAFVDSTRGRSLITIAYDEYGAAEAARPPVLLLHGSPGSGGDLNKLCAAVQGYGYRVLAPDLPGFGDSTRHPPDLSILSHAHEMLAFMDRLGIPRVHVVGWSLGGGVAMHMADLAPERVASLTLMASVSDQSVEGTRSYIGEHGKYAAGFAAASVVYYGTPHFGAFDFLQDIRASMRNFWDTDLRPLEGIMRRMRVPTLILHGRHDFLVPEWNAEHSHELIGPSTLVITEHSHFYPFMQPEIAAAHITPFLHRHDEPGVPGIRQRADLAPEGAPILGAWGRQVELALRRASWITLLAAACMILAWRLRTGAVLLIIAVSYGLIDNGIAFAAMFLVQAASAALAWWRGRQLRHVRVIGAGTAARLPEQWDFTLQRNPILLAMATRWVPHEQEAAFEALGYLRRRRLQFVGAAFVSWCLWMMLYFAATIAASAFIVSPWSRELEWLGLVLGVVTTVVLVRMIELLLTRHGRRRIRITWSRFRRREYWPTELLYWPMAPLYFVWGLRYGPIAFTACNPGIEGGGGVIGESKKAILDAMPEAAPWILRSVRIDRGEARARADEALAAIASNPALAFPVILKPDSGYRGFAVKLAREAADVREYFESMLAPAIVQEYHAGPQECGILWARHVEPAANGGLQGRIFSITRKTFPVLVGDGRRTLHQLVFAHPRFHAQAGVFLSRWAADRHRVLAEGEELRLAESGNHCQGTLFADGADLITAGLEARIDAIASSFQGGLDIGRFDLRYESDEALRRGEGFRIIELNGVTGESTNLYDPSRSIFWAYGVAIRQWRLMYQLGAERQRQGHKPLPVRELFRRIREHRRGRSGSALAD